MQAGELITTMPVGNRHVNFVLIKIAEKKYKYVLSTMAREFQKLNWIMLFSHFL